jgi:hypothetical protein
MGAPVTGSNFKVLNSGYEMQTEDPNTMKTISNSPETFESTYALIMRSEEKQRSRFEILVYTILIASATFAVAQFGRQATMMPSTIARISTTAPAASQPGV